jgi:hypothetical protein
MVIRCGAALTSDTKAPWRCAICRQGAGGGAVAQRVPGGGARPAAQPRGGHAAAVGVRRRAPQVRLSAAILTTLHGACMQMRAVGVHRRAPQVRHLLMSPACMQACACMHASIVSFTLRCRLLVPPCSCCVIRGARRCWWWRTRILSGFHACTRNLCIVPAVRVWRACGLSDHSYAAHPAAGRRCWWWWARTSARHSPAWRTSCCTPCWCGGCWTRI